MLSDKDRKTLLQVARDTIKQYLTDKVGKDPKDIPAHFREKRGVFVTLHRNGALRGCIGYIVPTKPLLQAVQECAISAATRDPRFPPLTVDELAEVDIEISVLSVPKKLEYTNALDLLSKLDSSMGVVLEKDGYSATFLPQVWEELKTKEDFLNHLCMKAGLVPDIWQVGKVNIETYTVELFSEEK